LSAAIALARAGFSVRVVERDAVMDAQGAGIQFGPNGVRILQAWGLEERMHERASTPQLRLMDAATGKLIAQAPLRDLATRFGAPYRVISRTDLHGMLLDAALRLNVEIVRGEKVQAINLAGRHVSVTTDKSQMRGAALIGADGIGSTVRSWLCPEAGLRFSGTNSWRAATTFDDAPDALRSPDIGVWLAPNAHVVHYPVSGGRELNVVAIVGGAQAPEEWGAPADANALTTRLVDWPRDITRFLGTLEWKTWPLMSLDGLARWSKGPVTLLGDAAHPLLPFLASGGVMAIEDAAVLAKEAGLTPDDLPGALARYEKARRPRIGRVLKASQRMGEIYHMGGFMRLARNAVMSNAPPNLLLARNDWLYGFRVSPED